MAVRLMGTQAEAAGDVRNPVGQILGGLILQIGDADAQAVLPSGQAAATRGRGDLIDIGFRGVFQPPGVDHHILQPDRGLRNGRRLCGRRGLGRRQQGRGQKGVQHGRVPD